MKWYDACMSTPFRAAHRTDGRGLWRIDVDGNLELVVRDRKYAERIGVPIGQIIELPTKQADQFKDWESNG